MEWADDSTQLADGALKEFLELDICSTKKKREMLVGMVSWEGSLTDFYRGTIRGPTEVEVALRAVDDALEAVFGRRLDLFDSEAEFAGDDVEPLPVGGVRGLHGEPDAGTVLPEDERAVEQGQVCGPQCGGQLAGELAPDMGSL